MEEYSNRNTILLELGFKDYKAYLRSDLWKVIRGRKLAKDPNCYGCGRDASNAQMQVHHSQYDRETLLGNYDKYVFSVCSRCHHWIEITRGGYKRNPTDATKELFRIRKLALAFKDVN